MITIRARLDLSHGDFTDVNTLLEKVGLNRGGRVQRTINDAVIRECRPYVPASPRRSLGFSVISDIDKGQVIWETPYARYQYYGKVMTDELGRTWVGKGEKKPIIHEDWLLTYDQAQNQLAGAYWFERMKADRLNDVLEEARKAVMQKE